MDLDNLKNIINDAFEDISNIDTNTKGEIRQSVDKTLELLDKGIVRVAEPEGNSKWKVNQWAKKAVLLSPQDAEAHNNLGSSLQQLRRLNEAE